jgi:hypothetical protein
MVAWHLEGTVYGDNSAFGKKEDLNQLNRRIAMDCTKQMRQPLRAGWPKDVMTSLYLCWGSTAEYFFLQELPNRNHCLYWRHAEIFQKKNRWDIEYFAFDAWWYNLW